MHRMHRIFTTTLLALAVITVCATSAFGLVPESPLYFPLDVGNRWIYTQDRFLTEEYEQRVLRAEEGILVVSLPSPLCVQDPSDPRPQITEFRLRVEGDAVDIEMDGQLRPYYRFAEESWIRNDLCHCDHGRTLTVASRKDVVETPAGTFSQCLRLEYGPVRCFDAGGFTEWWAPGVGRVKWEEQTFAGPVTFLLAQFEVQGAARKFRRGDMNQDSQVDLSDAIATFGFLFLGQGESLCPDAADSNDDGRVDISDGINTLSYLFAQGSSLPSQGPPPAVPIPPKTGSSARSTGPA